MGEISFVFVSDKLNLFQNRFFQVSWLCLCVIHSSFVGNIRLFFSRYVFCFCIYSKIDSSKCLCCEQYVFCTWFASLFWEMYVSFVFNIRLFVCVMRFFFWWVAQCVYIQSTLLHSAFLPARIGGFQTLAMHLNMNIYVSIYVYTYTCLCVYEYIHTYKHVSAQHRVLNSWMCSCIYIYASVYAYTYVYTCIYIYMCTGFWIRGCVHASVYICICICIYICVYMYIYICTCTYD